MDPDRFQTLLDKAKSEEEKRFMFWLKDAWEAGFLEDSSMKYEPFSLTLFDAVDVEELVHLQTKEKMQKRHIHQEECYECDFCLAFTEVGNQVLAPIFRKANAVRALGKGFRPDEIMIDVKGSYNPYQNDERYFSLVKKAVLFRYHMWVEKVIPFEKKGPRYGGLFKQTWAPEPFRWMKNRKVPTLTAMGEQCMSLDDFIASVGGKRDEKGRVKIGQQGELF